MDEAERIAREAHATVYLGLWENVTPAIREVALAAARLGMRDAAAKIADMKATLELYASRSTTNPNGADKCLARNFPAPKPSLREAARAASVNSRPSPTVGEGWEVVLSERMDALRDALAREEGKP